MKKALKVGLFLLTAAVLFAQTALAPITIPDIAGTGTATTIASAAAAYVPTGGFTTARSVTITSAASNASSSCGVAGMSGCPRIGDSNISTSRGTPLLPGQTAYLPPPDTANRYDLTKWYFLVQSGDKISITYVQ